MSRANVATYRIAGLAICSLLMFGCGGEGGGNNNTPPPTVTNDASLAQEAYVKASNTDADDLFGYNVTLSDDGNTLAVGASNEDSAATGVNGDQADNSANKSGAVYVFTRDSGGSWTQQAYVKAHDTSASDYFGASVVLSGDSHTLVVGARHEDSAATGVNGDQTDNSATDAGAVYVFR